MTIKRFFMGLVVSSLVAGACAKKKEETIPVIKSESQVLDLRLSEREPSKVNAGEEMVPVGFDSDGYENKMLVYFPKINELWDETVIVSAIASIEVIVRTTDLLVSPEALELYPVTRAWSPYATWLSPYSMLPESTWAAGGEFETALGAITPSVRRHRTDSSVFELCFDVTSIIKESLVNEKKGYGFVIQLSKNSTNFGDYQPLYTFNSSNQDLRPISILGFTKQDIFK